MSLRTKLILSVVLVGIASSFVSILVSVVVSTSIARDSASQIQSLVLTSVKKDVEVYLDNITKPLSEYSFSGAISPYMTNITDELGMSQLSWGVRNAYSALNAKGFLETYVVLSDMRVVSKDGIIQIDLPKQIINDILVGKKKVDIYIPYVYDGQNTILVAAAIYDFSDNIIGVLVGVYPLKDLQNMVSRLKVGKAGYVSLVYGTLTVVHPDSQYAGKLDLAKEEGTKALASEILSKTKGTVTYNFNGKKFAAFERIGNYNLTALGVLPYSEISSAGNQIITSGLFAGIIIALAAALVAILITGTITTRIDHVVEIAQKVAQNDLTAQVDEKKKAPGGRGPFGVSFSPDGAKIAVSFADSAKVNVLSGKDLSRLYSPYTGDITDGAMSSVSWSHDGKFLYAGGTVQKLANEGWKDIIRKWKGEGRGKSNDLVGDFSTVISIRPIYAGGIVFGSTKPAFGVFDASDRLVVYKRPAIADLSDNWEGFLVSYDGSTVQFGYEKFGKSPAKFPFPRDSWS